MKKEKLAFERNGDYKDYSYKIFNIAAHFEDIVNGEIQGNMNGYAITGSSI